jgi:hypothetical protein
MQELKFDQVGEVNGGFGLPGAILGGAIGGASSAFNGGGFGNIAGAIAFGAASGFFGGFVGHTGSRFANAMFGGKSFMLGVGASKF